MSQKVSAHRCILGILSLIILPKVYSFFINKPAKFSTQHVITPELQKNRFLHSFVIRPYHSTSLYQTANDNPENLQYLKTEFLRLANNDVVTMDSFVNGEEIQALIADGECTTAEIRDIWRQVVGEHEAANFQKFVAVNTFIDSLFEVDEEDGDDENLNADSVGYAVDENGILTADYVEDSIWDPNFKAAMVFEKEYLGNMRQFFMKSSSGGLLSYKEFVKWSDIVDLLEQGDIDKTCLRDVWKEALAESKTLPVDNKDGLVDYDTFLRINIRLDEVLEEIGEAVDNLTDEQKREYFRLEFQDLTKGFHLLGFDDFMAWRDLVEILDDGVVSREEIEIMWDALPKEPLSSKKGFGPPPVAIPTSVSRLPYGITSESFEVLNVELDNKLQMLQDARQQTHT